MQRWQLQDAEARLSELLRCAQAAPQGITLRGKPVAVVISLAAYEKLSQVNGSLLDFMQASPLAGSDEPAFEREPERARAAQIQAVDDDGPPGFLRPLQ